MVTAGAPPAVTTSARKLLYSPRKFHGWCLWMSCVDSSWSSWRWITPGISCLMCSFLLRTWSTRMERYSSPASSLISAHPYSLSWPGTGAFLATSRGKSIPQVSRFFLTRGLWLVLLEFTVVDFAWGFVPWVYAGVIWILGWSMVAMALIVRLPVRWIAVLGLDMIANHNLLDHISPASWGRFYWLWMMLHTPGRIPVTAHFSFYTGYVLIPWVGVMAAGFAFGTLLLRPDRRKWILPLGISATALFFVLRGLNLYGNGIAGLPFGYPRSAGPWSVQPTLSLTVISFFNTLKYPPSLDYLLMTLGPSLILLGLLDGAKAEHGLGRILLVYGRVPLFYYVLHLYLLHVMAILVALAFHQPIWHGTIIAGISPKPLGYGHGLPFVYAMWILAVAILYLPCLFYGTPTSASGLGLAKLFVTGA